MDTHIYSIEELFREVVQWVVPVYQRRYVWKSSDDKQIPGMWEDWKAQTEKLLNPDPKNPIRPHYFGAIIFSGKDKPDGELQKMDLVDGQQRLTTFQLAFVALRDVGNLLEYSNASDINNHIFNTFNSVHKTSQPERDKYKLWPSYNDRQIFQQIIAINDANTAGTSQLIEAYNCFCESIKDFIEDRQSKNKEPLDKLIDTLEKALLETFQVVIISLGNDDEPQQIFQSLNGMGEPLSPFDLIRNDIFYRARGNATEAERLFAEKWSYFEEPFWSTPQSQGRITKPRSDHFIVDVVIAQSAKEVNHRRIVAEYQKYIREGHFDSVSDELNALIKYGTAYQALQKPSGQITDRISKMFKLWDLSTMNPLVLWIDTRPKLSLEDKSTLFLMIESYIVRRHICKLDSKSFTKNVVSILAKMHEAEKQGGNIIEVFKRFLKNSKGESAKMPTDDEILDSCERMSIYGDNRNKSRKVADKLKYILEHVEKQIRGSFNEPIEFKTKELSIEHIMPQKWAANWLLKDGTKVSHESYWNAFEENPQLDISVKKIMETRESVIHTIGNLTLVTPSFNASLGNNSWEVKKSKIEQESSLILNRNIAKETKWNEDKIVSRSEELANHINKIWKHPSSE